MLSASHLCSFPAPSDRDMLTTKAKGEQAPCTRVAYRCIFIRRGDPVWRARALYLLNCTAQSRALSACRNLSWMLRPLRNPSRGPRIDNHIGSATSLWGGASKMSGRARERRGKERWERKESAAGPPIRRSFFVCRAASFPSHFRIPRMDSVRMELVPRSINHRNISS